MGEEQLSPNQVVALKEARRPGGASCNWVGQRLASEGLLTRHMASCSNLCFAGSAVLRSLARLGLVQRSRVEGQTRYFAVG